MTFRQKFLTYFAIAILATGVIYAAQLAGNHGDHGAMLATALDLTATQQETAKTLFQQAHTDAQPILDQLKQGHQAMAAAIKSGKSDAELTQLAAAQGALMGQIAAIHAKTFSKLYAQLTPQQRDKADQLHDHMQGMMMQHMMQMHHN